MSDHTGTGATGCGGGGGGTGGPGWYGGGGIGGGVGSPGELVLNGASSGGKLLDWSKINVPCPPDTCNVWDCVTEWIPYYDCVKAGVEAVERKYDDAANSGVSCAEGFVPVYSTMKSVVKCMSVAFDCLMSDLYHSPRLRNAPVLRAATNNKIPELMQSYYNKITPYAIYAECFINYAKEFYGASEMVDNITPELSQGIELVNSRLEELDAAGQLSNFDPLTDIPEPETDEVTDPYGFLPLLPQKQAVFYDFDVRRYIQRRINTRKLLLGQTVDSDNYIDNNRIELLRERVDSCKMALVDMGFATWEELVRSANADYLEYAEGQSKNVCATVKLEIEQKLVLTRQAFRGTLTMENGTSTQPSPSSSRTCWAIRPPATSSKSTSRASTASRVRSMVRGRCPARARASPPSSSSRRSMPLPTR